jgi:hypothetical protein
VVGSIASIAEQQDFLLVRVSADGAGVCLFFLQVVLDPCIRIELGNLFLVFDCVFGEYSAWKE